MVVDDRDLFLISTERQNDETKSFSFQGIHVHRPCSCEERDLSLGQNQPTDGTSRETNKSLGLFFRMGESVRVSMRHPMKARQHDESAREQFPPTPIERDHPEVQCIE